MDVTLTRPITKPVATVPRYPISHKCPFCGGSLIRRFEDGRMVCLSCSREPTATPAHIRLVLAELSVVKAGQGAKKFRPIDIDRMRLLHVEGWSYREIGEVVNASHEEVRQLLNGHFKYIMKYSREVGVVSFCMVTFATMTLTAELGVLVGFVS